MPAPPHYLQDGHLQFQATVSNNMHGVFPTSACPPLGQSLQPADDMFSLIHTGAGQVGAWQSGMTQGTLPTPRGCPNCILQEDSQFAEYFMPMIHKGLRHAPPTPRAPSLCLHCYLCPKCLTPLPLPLPPAHGASLHPAHVSNECL